MVRPGWPPRPDRRSSDRAHPKPAGAAVRSRIAIGFFVGPGWLKEPWVRITRKGLRKMSKHSMACAGIDTGKYKLDVAINGSGEHSQVDNSVEGYAALSAWLKRHRVTRVGIEASG